MGFHSLFKNKNRTLKSEPAVNESKISQSKTHVQIGFYVRYILLKVEKVYTSDSFGRAQSVLVRDLRTYVVGESSKPSV